MASEHFFSPPNVSWFSNEAGNTSQLNNTRHTRFSEAPKSDDFLGPVMVGVGLHFDEYRRPGLLPQVIHVEAGGAAADTGRIEVGDRLQEVDENDVQMLETEKIAWMLYGPQNTSVHCKFIRDTDRGQEVFSVEIRRETKEFHSRRRFEDKIGTDSSFGAVDPVENQMRMASTPIRFDSNGNIIGAKAGMSLSTVVKAARAAAEHTRNAKKKANAEARAQKRAMAAKGQLIHEQSTINLDAPDDTGPLVEFTSMNAGSSPFKQRTPRKEESVDNILDEEDDDDRLVIKKYGASKLTKATVGLILDGCTVGQIVPGSPAHKCKLLSRGDIIRTVGGEEVTPDTVDTALRGEDRPGEIVTLHVKKPDRSITEARLRAMPTKNIEFPFMIMDSVEQWRQSVKQVIEHCEATFKKMGVLDQEQDYLDAHKKEIDAAMERLVKVYSDTEEERQERDLLWEDENLRLKNEVETFKSAHANKVKEARELDKDLRGIQAKMDQLFDEDLRATIEENLRLKSNTGNYEAEIKRLKDILAQHADTNEQAQKAVDKVSSLTETCLSQTNEIFRLNEMVIKMDAELQEARVRLRHYELELEEAMYRWHDADLEAEPLGKPVMFDPTRSLAGTWVPMS